MRRWMAAPLVFVAAAALTFSTDAPQARAQAKAAPPEEETFLTADGIQLRGLFHKSTKSPATDPVVILLYPPGKDQSMIKGDWEGLANRLAGEGYNVFRFDWRGHGKSDDIKDTKKFWENPYTGPWNRAFIAGAGKKPIKNQLFFKDLTNPNAYFPVYLTDLAAVRAHLDSKNDAGDVNTSSIYLIGAESAATLGLGWLATEWNRPAFVPTPNQLGLFPRYDYVPQPLNGGVNSPAGEDVSGAIWLSPSRPQSISPGLVKGWVSGVVGPGRQLPLTPKTRDNNPMMFLYGDKDSKGRAMAEFFHVEALVGKGDKRLGLSPLNDKYLREVKNGGTLPGVALLGNNQMLGTEDSIMKFLEAIQKERKQLTRKPRGYTAPYFIQLPAFGVVLGGG